MKANPILEQIQTQRLDFSGYGNFPIVEDVIIMEERDPELKKRRALFDQFKKLKYIRKNLRLLDKYIQTNRGETLSDWLVEAKSGMSQNVLSQIGNSNNDTGGISAYFFNLQNFYDLEEEIYDKFEADSKAPDDIATVVKNLRETRGKKRSNRGKVRKIMVRDMKADNKGYIYIDIEAPKKLEKHELNADGENQSPDSTSSDPNYKLEDEKTAINLNTDTGAIEGEKNETDVEKEPNSETRKVVKRNIKIWIAGSLLILTGFAVLGAVLSEDKK